MIEPESWPTWLQVPFLVLLILAAAMAWFTIGYGGLLVAGIGVLFALYLRYRERS